MKYDSKRETQKKALSYAAGFVGWTLLVVFLMIGLQAFVTGILGWDGYGSGFMFCILGIILIVAPTVIVATYIEDHEDD